MANVIQFRMNQGWAGDITRTHPSPVLPKQADPTNPPTLPGQGVIFDATSGKVRKIITADSTSGQASGTYPYTGVSGSISLDGVTVREFPIQQQTTSANFGAVAIGNQSLPSSFPLGIITSGSIIVTLPTSATPLPGGPVYIWNNTTSGSHVQGSFESAYSIGNTVLVANAKWLSGVDANGNAELAFNL